MPGARRDLGGALLAVTKVQVELVAMISDADERLIFRRFVYGSGLEDSDAILGVLVTRVSSR